MRTLAWMGMLITLPAIAQQTNMKLTVTKDITLDKDAVLSTPLVIEADNVTIDGNGATIQGPGQPGELKTFVGAGVFSEGHSNITIRNLKVRGFESGLVATDGQNWLIENCDFSDNYHNPDYGWGDYKRVGGMILTRINKSTVRNCKANNVWNALDLWESDDNTIDKCDFSHCSNVCLKMWTACRNVVTDCNLSYGLRISPGEVHARDSTSVLIESGSNDNRYERNDVTHGGDGIFIRVLNGWVSTGNIFIENDCSYANNNGFEAWSPGNVYIRNKSNHCSYGFWLGGSDDTVLIGNEAAYNGQPDGFHNAPVADFQHGGIVIVYGTGKHTVIDGNYCHHNNGAGIVFRGDIDTRGAKWNMQQMIVQNNRLEANRWGLFVSFTDGLDLAGNTFKDNEQDEFIEEVTNLTRREADPKGKPAPQVVLEGPEHVQVGKQVTFDASGSKDAIGRELEYHWNVSGQVYTGPKIEHTFDQPGFYRVAVTANNGYLAGLDFRDVYVFEPVKEMGTEGQAAKWGYTMGGNESGRGNVTFTNDKIALVGNTSTAMRPDPYLGADVAAVFPKSQDAGWKLSDDKTLKFWIKFRNENNSNFQGPNPIIRLHSGDAAYTYMPVYAEMPRNLLGDLPYAEARYGWLYVEVPLAGNDSWKRSETFAGGAPPQISNNMKFSTLVTSVQTQESCSLVSDGRFLYLLTIEGDRLLRSKDGVTWEDLPSPPQSLKATGGGWYNGVLAFYPKMGERGSLLMRLREPQRDEHGDDVVKIVSYDIASSTWLWMPTRTIISHGTAIAGDYLFGIAHAIAGNYGGPICRINLVDPPEMEDRTVLGPMPGKDQWWFGRGSQLVELDGKIYGIKNDWQTPQPEKPEDIGDRLYVFDPAAYAVSDFAGGKIFDTKNWKAATTPTTDLGALPFEVGHGAALVALPQNWCDAIGDKGGLFIVAGSSPSNHEGWGATSNKYALYDVASGNFTLGALPDVTGNGTAATLHNNKVYIKRGGVNFAPSNSEMWVIEPVTAEEARATQSQMKREKISLDHIDYMSIQFDTWGNEPFTIWFDGLAFE